MQIMIMSLLRDKMNGVGGQNTRRRPPVKWRDRVNEYWRQKDDKRGLDHAVRECQNRERWRILWRGHFLDVNPRRRKQHWRYK